MQTQLKVIQGDQKKGKSSSKCQTLILITKDVALNRIYALLNDPINLATLFPECVLKRTEEDKAHF